MLRTYTQGLAYQRPGTIAAATEANNANGGFPEPEDYRAFLRSELLPHRGLTTPPV